MLRVLVDRRDSPARFLILGSASPELLRQGSETLAGRIAFHELEGSPTTTKSMHAALETLDLDRLDVIHAGEHTFPMRDRIRAVAFNRIGEDLEPPG